MAGSVALHGLVALLIPALVWTAASGDAVPTISFAHIARIQIQPTPHPIPLAQAPHLQVKPNVSLASDAAPSHATSRHTVHANTTHGQPASAPRTAPVTRLGEGRTQVAAAPQATPSPAVRTVSGTVGRDTGGYMPFGAEQPTPVLDPTVLKQLTALGIHLTLTVTVGEDGKTKTVAYEPSIDDATKSKIAALLSDAEWDPAVCGGGIACEGTATIKL
ncbi:MAG TPA: hypothetical protein VGF18_08585 [Candidatus Tumulicola sp.]|jgi:hypothetical protein